MADFKIGAMVESFRLDTFEAIRHAAALGVPLPKALKDVMERLDEK